MDQCIEDLWAGVYDRPDQDEPRRALAEGLLARGDLRGELISLQLQPTRSRAERRRVRQLLSLHGRAWLGELAPVVERPIFRRGFLAEARLTGGRQQVAALRSSRTWATVEVLELGAQEANQAILHPAMCSLRELRGLDDSGLVLLCEAEGTPWPLEAIEARIERWSTCDGLSRCGALSGLGRLALSGPFATPWTLDWLWASPWARRLERLTVEANDPAMVRAFQEALAERSGLKGLSLVIDDSPRRRLPPRPPQGARHSPLQPRGPAWVSAEAQGPEGLRALGTAGGLVRLLEASSDLVRWEVEGDRWVRRLRLSPEGRLLGAVAGDMLRVFAVEGGQELAHLRLACDDFDFSPDGAEVLLDLGRCEYRYEVATGDLLGARWSPRGGIGSDRGPAGAPPSSKRIAGSS